DGILAGPVRPQAGRGDLGRGAEAGVEHDVNVGPGEDRVDVPRHRRPEPDVEPARLAEIEPVLCRAIDDPATELEPRPGQPGLDDHPAGPAGGPNGCPDSVHHAPSSSMVREANEII